MKGIGYVPCAWHSPHGRAWCPSYKPLAESHYWIGQCFAEQKDREKAKVAFQEVIKLAPDTELSAKSKGKIEELYSEK